jgi:bifunctional enzyme CysN/CysC
MADAPQTIEAFLVENERKELLRFSTAGSIDDGKSTLIGRLLHDSKNVYADQLASVKNVSREKASEEQIDFALLTDGLTAEREQGITIDVAYRYFSTPRRKYIIADTPGHEQYTRNMATGASTANLAIVLIDARNGVLPQTKRHAFISALLGVPHMIVAVNKMDLVDYSQEVYEAICNDFKAFAGRLQIPDLRFIPVSALRGDNVVNRSSRMSWYTGEALLELLDTVYIGSDNNLIDLRFPVQYVLRPHLDFRGYCGQVVSGIIRKGDEVVALPSMKTSRVKSIETFDGPVDEAFPPMSVTVTIEDERDISRGEMLVHRHNLPVVDRHFEAMIVWMGETPLDPNRAYLVKHTTRVVNARIDAVRYRVDVNALHHEDADTLHLNEIGRVVLTSLRPLFHDAYRKNRGTGSFILIDPISNNTVAAGMIIDREPSDQLPSSIRSMGHETATLRHRESGVSPEARVARFGQRPSTIWLTGLVGSGRTEVAYALEKRLFDMGAVPMVLDGVNVRLGLSRELDFTSTDRAEHLRRVAELARLANESGLITVCSFVSPSAAIRGQLADVIGRDRFLEIHVDADIDWCRDHDATGLYERADQGEVDNVAGVDVSYEPPEAPALVVSVKDEGVDAVTDRIISLLRERGIFPVHG